MNVSRFFIVFCSIFFIFPIYGDRKSDSKQIVSARGSSFLERILPLAPNREQAESLDTVIQPEKPNKKNDGALDEDLELDEFLDDDEIAEIEGSKQPSRKEKTSILNANGQVQGQVMDSQTGQPIADAVVELKNANFGVGYYQVKTDSKGFFLIKNFISRVRYRLSIHKQGYVDFRRSGNVQQMYTPLSLVREGILKGNITDSRQKPLAGVKVRIKMRGYSNSRPKFFTSDSKGRFFFDKLEEGSYEVQFSRKGWITETAYVKKISAGTVFQLPMLLYKPARIAGRLKIGNLTKPLPAKNVYITLRRGNVHHSTYSYGNGTFLIDGIKPGRYRLKLNHRGFESLPEQTIELQEGQKKTDLFFTLKPKQPAVYLSARRYVFPPGRKVSFSMRSLRLEKVQVKIFSVKPAELLSPPLNPQKASDSQPVVDQWQEAIQHFRPFNWRYNQLEIKKALPTGAYRIEVSGAGKAIDSKYFTVTSSGIVVKRSQNSIFVYATDLITNQPLTGAKINVFAEIRKKGKKDTNFSALAVDQLTGIRGKIILKGKTNEYGVFHQKLNSNSRLYIYAIAQNGNFAICQSGPAYHFSGEVEKYYIYTDRPTYRAGHRVFFKVVAKKRQQKFQPIGPKMVKYSIKHRSGDSAIEEGNLRLDDWGTAYGEIQLAEQLKLGRYQIAIDDAQQTGSFYVEQYRKPEFKINIQPEKAFFTNGNIARFKVEAKYFFGSPLRNALVSYRFYESRLNDSSNRYWWEEDYQYSTSYRRVKLEGEKYLDENGIAHLALDCGNYPYDREISLEVSIIDSSNVSVSANARVNVGRGEYYIKIRPKYSFFASDETKIFTIETLDFANQPVSAQVDVKFYRYIWKPWQRVYVHEDRPLYRTRLQTDKNGQAIIKIDKKLQTSGEIDVIASSLDSKENEITASHVFWLYDRKNEKIRSKFKNLQISVREKQLEKSGNITILVKSRFAGIPICLTLEGKDIYDKKVIIPKTHVTAVQFPIKPEYAPNLFINATMQKNRGLFTTSEEISLPYRDTKLSIAIKADKEKYGPAETVRLKVRTSDENGKPTAADVSLAVVDEAIFQIRRDFTPRIHPFFYSKISNWVSTNYSFPIHLLAGAGKSGKKRQIRKNFKDTAYWNPTIKTNKKGMAQVSFPLPDNLTTWRITCRGHDRRGRLGEKRHKILVSKDLITRIGKPRFFSENDSLSVIGIVNNNSEQGMAAIQTEFRYNGKPIQPKKKMAISLPPSGSFRNYYPIKIKDFRKPATLTFSAQAGKNQDSVQYKVPVKPMGVPLTRLYTADKDNARTLIPIESNRELELIPQKLEITVHSSILSRILSSLNYLTDYPYGCSEQTISKFLPALYLNDIWQKKNGKDRVMDEKLDQKVKQGIARIENFQNYDGTWGYWYGSTGNESLTGYALLALQTAQQKGYSVNEDIINGGIDAIETALGKKKDPYLLYTYHLLQKNDLQLLKNVYQASDTTNAYQLAYLIKSLVELKKQLQQLQVSKQTRNAKQLKKEQALNDYINKIPELVNRLKNLAKQDSQGVYFTDGKEISYHWGGGRTEISAVVLSALQQARDTSPLSARLLASIYNRSRGNFWNSTRETAYVLMALADYLQNHEIKPVQATKIEILANQKPVATFAIHKNTTVPLQKTISLLDNRQGKNIEIVARGLNSQQIFLSYRLQATLQLKNDRIPMSYKQGIKVQRDFFRIKRVLDLKNQEYLVPQKWQPEQPIQVGEEIMVRIRIETENDYENIAIEDFLPAGFEVTRQDAYGSSGYIRKEKWDDRMVFFYETMDKDKKYELAYIIRAELPGQFYIQPTRAECMYEPSIRSWSLQHRIQVEQK